VTRASRSSERPALARLAFAYHPVSFGAIEVARAASGVCELVWVIDTSMSGVAHMARLLARLGVTVDVAGLDHEPAAAAIAAEHVQGILALHDDQLCWTAAVAQTLGLPFHTPQVAERMVDKYLERSALAAAGVPVPAFWAVPALDDDAGWRALAANACFPAMVKPRRAAGSRDVVRVDSLALLREHLAEIPGGAGTRANEMILERYLQDRESDLGAPFAGYVSVESIVSAGTVSHLAIMGRTPPVEPFRESGFFIPSALEGEDRERVLELATTATRASGVEVGTMHTEIKLTPQGPHVIEINGRLGGGTPQMLAAVSDIDLLAIAMRIALGESIVFAEMPPLRGVMFVLYSHAPMGMRRVVAVEGLELLREDPRVSAVMLNRPPGGEVDWREGNWGHVFSVHGIAADHDDLRAMIDRIAADTRIVGE
jgi:ATP-grasp domain